MTSSTETSGPGMAATVSTETDFSGSGMAATVSTETTENVAEFPTEDDHLIKQPRKLFFIKNTFVKSWSGIFLAAEMVLSLLGAFCVMIANGQDCRRIYTNVYIYYNVIAISCLVISTYLYGLKFFNFNRRVCCDWKCFVTGKLGLRRDCCWVRLNTLETVTVGLLLPLFLIASIAVAVNTCGLAGYKVGCCDFPNP